MPGAMTCRVPEGLSVNIQPQSKGLRPKADVGPLVAPPSRNSRRTLPQASLPGLAARLGRMLSRGQLAERTRLASNLLCVRAAVGWLTGTVVQAGLPTGRPLSGNLRCIFAHRNVHHMGVQIGTLTSIRRLGRFALVTRNCRCSRSQQLLFALQCMKLDPAAFV
jgi:hypothetical protein